MTKYFEEYDAYYNFKTDTWSEEKCNDKTCEYCKGRPNKPSEVKNE